MVSNLTISDLTLCTNRSLCDHIWSYLIVIDSTICVHILSDLIWSYIWPYVINIDHIQYDHIWSYVISYLVICDQIWYGHIGNIWSDLVWMAQTVRILSYLIWSDHISSGHVISYLIICYLVILNMIRIDYTQLTTWRQWEVLDCQVLVRLTSESDVH